MKDIKINIVLFFLISTTCPLYVFGQFSGTLNYRLGIYADNITVINDNLELNFLGNKQPAVTLFYEQKFNQNNGIEIGIIDKYFHVEFQEPTNKESYSRSLTGYFVTPITYNHYIPLYKGFSIISKIGITNYLKHSTIQGENNFKNPKYNLTTTIPFRNSYQTYNLGVGLEYKISKKWKLEINYTNNIHSKVEFKSIINDNTTERNINIQNNGSSNLFTFGVGYKILGFKKQNLKRKSK